MAQSLSNILLHIVFSTRNRRPEIGAEIEPQLFANLTATGQTLGCPIHAVGGAADHIHIACSLSRANSASKLVQELKQASSKWLKTQGSQFADFDWQNGFAAFSISQSELDDLRGFIGGQREYHRGISFQDEYRELLTRHGIEFVERHVWD
ncbi:MAG TPA: transposase [Pirellulales bacterium]